MRTVTTAVTDSPAPFAGAASVWWRTARARALSAAGERAREPLGALMPEGHAAELSTESREEPEQPEQRELPEQPEEPEQPVAAQVLSVGLVLRSVPNAS